MTGLASFLVVHLGQYIPLVEFVCGINWPTSGWFLFGVLAEWGFTI